MAAEIKEGVFEFIDLIVKIADRNRLYEFPIEEAKVDKEKNTLTVVIPEWYEGTAILVPIQLDQVVSAVTYPKKVNYQVLEPVEPRDILADDSPQEEPEND